MTPVRIRGKPGQKKRLHALHEQRAQQAITEETTSLSPLNEPRSSMLESLPTEILESIFLYSQNFSFPGSSLTLCRALSSRHLQNLTLRSILTPIDPDENTKDESRELGKLQSMLLRWRWADYSTIQRRLYDLQATALASFIDYSHLVWSHFHNPHLVRGDSPRFQKDGILGPACPLGDASLSAIRRFFDSLDRKAPTENVRWMGNWTSNSNDEIDLWIPSYSCLPMFMWWKSASILGGCNKPIGRFELASGCKIPTKLLHGPWTDSKVEFLETLEQAGAELDWETGNSGEVAESSLKEAILNGNVKVLKALSKRPSIDLMPPTEQYSREVGVPLTQEHLRLAILEAGCDELVVTAIVDAFPPESRSKSRDNDIYEWAIDQDSKGNERGTWLLHQLESWVPPSSHQ
ncbi:MAG: hypothetical protein LQ350_000747 [Teloschistes chrysophthalmus]|nr:MAG: hypothetical protein LQ350_000747 [Niorma chrysophthalma]